MKKAASAIIRNRSFLKNATRNTKKVNAPQRNASILQHNNRILKATEKQCGEKRFYSVKCNNEPTIPELPFPTPDFSKLQKQPLLLSSFDNSPFANREQGTQRLIAAALRNLGSSAAKSVTKQDYTFIWIVGASGAGKTRACAAAGQLLRDSPAIKSRNIAVFEVYIDFLNGDKIDRFEVDLRPSAMMGLRLYVKLFSAHCTVHEYVTAQGKEQVRQELLNGRFALSKVVNEFAKAAVAKYGQQQQSILCVSCDEYQFTLNSFDEKQFKMPVRSLGGEELRNRSNPNLTILPIIAGTLPKTLAQFSTADYVSDFFPLPLFQYPTIEQLALAQGVSPHFFETQSLKRFWSFVGMLPRTLQHAIQAAKKQEVQTIDDLHNAVMQNITRVHCKPELPYTEEHDRELLGLALTGFQISENQQWIRDLALQGELILDDDNRVAMHYFTFSTLLSKTYPAIARLLPTNSEDFSWQGFKNLLLHMLTLRLSLSPSSIPLRTLFQGHMDPSLASLQLECGKRLFVSETSTYLLPVITTRKKTRYTISELVPSSAKCALETIPVSEASKCSYVFLAHPTNHPLVYGRFFAVTTFKHNVVVLMQCEMKTKSSFYGPEEWVKHMQKVVKEYQKAGYIVILVYITNDLIPNTKHLVKQFGNLVIIDHESLDHFPPMLKPYVSTIDYSKEEDEEDRDD